MLSIVPRSSDGSRDVWRALANPIRRDLLDELARGPRTTGELAEERAEVSRYAVMQHLDVLVDAGLVVVRRQGRNRFNYINAVPLRTWYERWVVPLADRTSQQMLAAKRGLESRQDQEGALPVAVATDQFRTVRIENELRFKASPQRVFEAMTTRTGWFPATYGESRVKEIVLEPRVGGSFYEDWGDGRGHMYGQITEYDPPYALAYRGRLDMGTILDTEFAIERDGDYTVLKVSKVAVGPIDEAQAAGIHRYGDLMNFEEALRKFVEED
jgi:DNA-binding transcriptional ArsR family regulator/uncharacterized protein YndB with AHSA1/START domain